MMPSDLPNTIPMLAWPTLRKTDSTRLLCSSTNNLRIMLIIPILIISALSLFYNNTALALWHDEAFSALYIRYPWGEMMHRIGLDVHPPLYYWVLRVWSYGAGDSLLSL